MSEQGIAVDLIGKHLFTPHSNSAVGGKNCLKCGRPEENDLHQDVPGQETWKPTDRVERVYGS